MLGLAGHELSPRHASCAVPASPEGTAGGRGVPGTMAAGALVAGTAGEFVVICISSVSCSFLGLFVRFSMQWPKIVP